MINMENKIPTAEEFLIKENLPIDILSGDDINYFSHCITIWRKKNT